MDKKDNKDIRKDIEELEKLIEDVKKQNAEEKKRIIKEQKSAQPNVIKINLALDYSNNIAINFIVGFLVNFILFYLIIEGFRLASSNNQMIYLLIAIIFTTLEFLMKQFMLKKHVKLVLYSSGLIFFLFNLTFIYAIDLLVPLELFSFENYLYPIVFVVIFLIVRAIFKQLYILSVNFLNKKLKKS
jgi:hypothetical protein